MAREGQKGLMLLGWQAGSGRRRLAERQEASQAEAEIRERRVLLRRERRGVGRRSIHEGLFRRHRPGRCGAESAPVGSLPPIKAILHWNISCSDINGRFWCKE